jgi:Tfp pilus assembly protein PilW
MKTKDLVFLSVPLRSSEPVLSEVEGSSAVKGLLIRPHLRKPGIMSGFSLMEFLIAMTAFIVVCAAGGLVISPLQQRGFTMQQDQSRLNLGLRNAIAQLQLDVANAGSGFYPGPGVSLSPLGLVVTNSNTGSSPSSCYSSGTYGSTCFDQLSVLSFTGTNIAPAHPASTQLTTSTSMTLTPPSGITAANYAAALPSGTQMLFMKSDGSQFATVVLTQNSSTTGTGNTQVKIQFNATNSSGYSTSSTNDPLGIFLSSYTYTTGKSLQVGTSYGVNDWALAISSVTYKVDTTTASNPKLVRQTGSSTTTDEIAEQIIGFQVGAGVPGPQCATGSSSSTVPYVFNPANYCYNWSQIQSLRISIIGRTNPAQPIPSFQNSFDQQPYKIESLTAVVSPRNMCLQ